MPRENSTQSPLPNFGSCIHIKTFSKHQATLNSYKAIFENCVAISASKSSIKEVPTCDICKSCTGRIHACLHSIDFVCIEKNHLSLHYKKSLSKNKEQQLASE